LRVRQHALAVKRRRPLVLGPRATAFPSAAPQHPLPSPQKATPPASPMLLRPSYAGPAAGPQEPRASLRGEPHRSVGGLPCPCSLVVRGMVSSSMVVRQSTNGTPGRKFERQQGVT
jgi:hypothetical protein